MRNFWGFNNQKWLPLRWKMFMALLVCWWIPLLFLTIITIYVNARQVNRQIETTVEISVDKVVDYCDQNLYTGIIDSRNASYFWDIKDANRLYRTTGDEQVLYEATTNFLMQQYQYNELFRSTLVYYNSTPEQLYYTYRNSNTNYYLDSVRWFETQAKAIVQEELQEADSMVKFIVIEDRLYMIRNILDSNQRFEPIAALIMEMNVDYVFESMNNIWNYQESSIYINGKRVMGELQDEDVNDLLNGSITKEEFSDSHENYIIRTSYVEGQKIDYLILLDSDIWSGTNSTIRIILLGWLVMMVPLVFLIVFFFHYYVTKPVRGLVGAVKKIEREEYGYEIPEDSYREEFKYLAIAYNHMSRKLQKQFEQIYLEELALKDAKINALQSQINPHFLNNTLEIINWEARMVENYKVSEMIEALSTMLEATTNRSGDTMIPLAEELSYIEAYLFIVKQRFGKKLKIIKEIDDSLLQQKVPKLIIQPIIENAVEHGINIQKQAVIYLKIYALGENLYVEIIDNGLLSDENQRKIDLLLSDEGGNAGYTYVSIGIRNVHSRLKFIYGELYGLTIKKNEDDYTVSTLTMKLESQK